MLHPSARPAESIPPFFRAGHGFKLALQTQQLSAVKRPEDVWILVHGVGRFSVFHRKVDMAWLEADQGHYLYLPIHDKLYCRKTFMRRYCPQEYARYDRAEASLLSSKYSSFGPWPPNGLDAYHQALTY